MTHSRRSISIIIAFMIAIGHSATSNEDILALPETPQSALPLTFEANWGQAPDSVRYLSRAAGYLLSFTEDSVVLNPTLQSDRSQDTSRPLTITFPGNSPEAKLVGVQEQAQVSNYFIGNDPSKWRVNVPHYARVQYQALYEGIDHVYYADQGQLRYDFIVSPSGHPQDIVLQFSGADHLELLSNGSLLISLQVGELRQAAPFSYQRIAQTQVEVPSRFVLLGNNRVGFEVGIYDREYPLIIDPALIYSSYLGGSGTDQGRDVAVDSTGAVYLTGYTESVDFPLLKPLDNTLGGRRDIFVTKLSAAGNAIIYSTYIGGSQNDTGYQLALDDVGEVYVTGFTESSNFPRVNPVDSTYGGINEAFILKLSTTGNALIFSSYFGGSSIDVGYSVALDSTGAVYVTGGTQSANLPLRNALDASLGGPQDGFLVKLDSSGTSIVYSTYLGGNDFDSMYGIVVDSTDAAIVVGYSSSSNFPLANALDSSLGGTADIVAAKFAPTGDTLLFSTYLGGGGGDEALGVAVDSSNAIYVVGLTDSIDFPVQNAFDGTLGGSRDVFAAKLTPAGNALLYSTYVGGSQAEFLNVNGSGHTIRVDAIGSAYVCGTTDSTDFPTLDPIQTDQPGSDAFIVRLSATGNAMRFGTYLGGTGNDYGSGLAIDQTAAAYLVGNTDSADYPTRIPIQTDQGSSDAFISKLQVEDPTATPTPTSTATPTPTSMATLTSMSATQPAVPAPVELPITGYPPTNGSPFQGVAILLGVAVFIACAHLIRVIVSRRSRL